MDPFEIAKRTELNTAVIYTILARFFDDQPALKTLFERLVKEKTEHSRRVERWGKAWKNRCPERPPRADMLPLAKLTRRMAAFSEQLKQAEVVAADAAMGLAICLEQKLGEAHRTLQKSEMGALFSELGKLEEEHLGLLLRCLTGLDDLKAAPKLPCDSL